MRLSPRWIGIDLGASAIDAVALTIDAGGRARVCGAATYASSDLQALLDMTAGAERIAIDAPDQLSTAPHGSEEAGRSPKFRGARCGEIALAELEGIWVPWTTPAEASAAAGWMRVGFAVWAALREAGFEPIETYPAGVFRVLADGQFPNKRTVAGRRARIELLGRHLELPEDIDRWSHDGIDALAAALVARWSNEGLARAIGHTAAGCDSSAIWLPGAA